METSDLIARLKSQTNHLCAITWRIESRGTNSFLAVNNKVVVFDSLAHAQDFCNKLGGGRLFKFSPSGDVCKFYPYDPLRVNIINIITEYDPYNLPAGNVVSSETRLKEWKNHITVWAAFYDIGGNMQTDTDGNVTNLALGPMDTPLGKDTRFIE